MKDLTCPECDEPLRTDEEWRLIKPWLLGEPCGDTEDMQGDYAHERCVEP